MVTVIEVVVVRAAMLLHHIDVVIGHTLSVGVAVVVVVLVVVIK